MLPLHTSPANLTILCACCWLPWLRSPPVRHRCTALIAMRAPCAEEGGGCFVLLNKYAFFFHTGWGEKRFCCIFTRQVSIKYSCTLPLRCRATLRLCLWRQRSRSSVSDCEFHLICSLMSAACSLCPLSLLLICPRRRQQSGCELSEAN